MSSDACNCDLEMVFECTVTGLPIRYSRMQVRRVRYIKHRTIRSPESGWETSIIHPTLTVRVNRGCR